MALNPALSRYKPAILVIFGASCALGIYYAFESLQNQNAPQTLHRSNAVHRRTRDRPNTRRPQGDAQAADEETSVRQLIDPDGTRNYGRYRIIAQDGVFHYIDLHLPRFPTLDELHQRFGLPGAQAVRVYDDIERTYVHRWIALNFPSHQPFTGFSTFDADTEALLASLAHLGLSHENMAAGVERYNSWYNAGQPSEEIGMIDPARVMQTGDAADGAETVAGTEQEWDGRTRWDGRMHHHNERDGQGLKQMLYYIAEHQSREEGYIHRGVTCNSCDIKPIRGIRWRCANCPDFDLCSDCESSDIHNKTHIFYKVKIPAPFMGNPRHTQPVIYPGKPKLMPRHLNIDQRTRLMKDTTFEMHEVDAIYDQFTCLADCPWPQDPHKICGAIDRVAFDKAFVPIATSNTPRPNLVYDRMFAFYDTNADGLIGFEEFLNGLACLHSKEKVNTRLRRVFDGYDLDSDGYVCRKDFLRIFRAYYANQKEVIRDLLAIQEVEDDLTIAGAMDIIMSSQPLSAAFTDAFSPPGDLGDGSKKHRNAFGDKRLTHPVASHSEDVGNRSEVIGNAWERRQGFHFDINTGNPLSRSHMHGAPVTEPAGSDSGEGSRSGTRRPISDMRDEAIRERWRRREFYTDEEEGYVPPARILDEDGVQKRTTSSDYEGSKSEQNRGNAGAMTPRSRSSSKVRFQEAADLETRSNNSTSSRPHIEHFGGYEIPQLEKDYGQEILYQVTQQGLNELLDPLFKKREDRAMKVESTGPTRRKWKHQMEEFKRRSAQEADSLKETSDQGSALDNLPEGTTEHSVQATEENIKVDTSHSVDGFDYKPQPLSADEGSARPMGDRGPFTNNVTNSVAPLQSHHLTAPSRPLRPQDPDYGNGTQSLDVAIDELHARANLADANQDPTLPHHRPNSVSEIPAILLNGTQAQLPLASLREVAASTTERRQREDRLQRFSALVLGLDHTAAFQMPHGAWHIASPTDGAPLRPNLPSSKGTAPRIDAKPTEQMLAEYVSDEEAEEEIRKRGGPGRLSYDEFEKLMKSENGRPLGFLEGWLELEGL